jgi:hypothetical protein
VTRGWYRITLKSNAGYNNDLPLKKVGIYITTDAPPRGQPRGWFWTVEEPNPQFIFVNSPNSWGFQLYAYFIDIYCGDNIGTATLFLDKISN